MDEDDININSTTNQENIFDYFDLVIGHIEDIVMGKEFQELRKDFLEQYWQEFNCNEEEYSHKDMEIYQNYTKIFEHFITQELTKRIDNFDMSAFAKYLDQNSDLQIDSEIFDIIHSLLDFFTFKEMMLDYKADKEGKFDDLKNGIIITKLVKD